MNVCCVSSALSKTQIAEKSKILGFLPVSARLVRSHDQLELAHLLAKRSFNSKTNLAKVFELEFLLWLSGETDIRQALSKNGFSPRDFFLIWFKKQNKNKLLRELRAKERPLALETSSPELYLEEVSLGRVL